MPHILFDESHEELLRSQVVSDDPEIDTWDTLRAALEDWGWQISVHPAGAGPLHEELLDTYAVLVLAAPGQPLSQVEIKSIANFIEQGACRWLPAIPNRSGGKTATASMSSLSRSASALSARFIIHLKRSPPSILTTPASVLPN
jgi:hypothetical protein